MFQEIPEEVLEQFNPTQTITYRPALGVKALELQAQSKVIEQDDEEDEDYEATVKIP